MSESVVMKEQGALAAFLADPVTIRGSAGDLVIAALPRQTYINLRGDSADPAFRKAVLDTCGSDLPAQANSVATGPCTIYWLGPDEWLLRDADSNSDLCVRLQGALRGLHAACNDLSHGYVTLSMRGRHAIDLLAKGCTLDLRDRSFAVQTSAQSAIARSAVLLARTGVEDWDLIVRRTFAEYLAHWLRHAGREFGVTFDAAPSQDG